MHSNKLGGTLRGLLYMSPGLYPRLARLGITPLNNGTPASLSFLHNTTDPMERVCAYVCAYVPPVCVAQSDMNSQQSVYSLQI